MIKNRYDRAEVLVFIAEALATFAKSEAAQILEEAIESVGSKWSGPGTSLRVRQQIPLAYISIQDYSGALSVIRKLEEPHEQAELVGEFVIAIVKDSSVNADERKRLLASAHRMLSK